MGTLSASLSGRAADFEDNVLTSEQWSQMAELLAVLTPVKALCDKLETSNSPSLSLFIPLTCKLMDVLFHLTDGESSALKVPCCRALCEKVRLSVYTRMTAALCDPPCMLAMMLDPRVRTKEIKNYNKDIAEQHLRRAFIDFPTTLARFRGADSVCLRHSTVQREQAPIEPAAKRAKYVLELDEEKGGSDELLTEVDHYLREPSLAVDQCCLAWWLSKKDHYPVLFEMARVYLAIPASSAPSERVFSVGSLVLSEKRRQLHENRVARLMFMKRNMKVFNQLTNNTKH